MLNCVTNIDLCTSIISTQHFSFKSTKQGTTDTFPYMIYCYFLKLHFVLTKIQTSWKRRWNLNIFFRKQSSTTAVGLNWAQVCICTGSVAERSKALVLGTSLFGGVGSNPTAAKWFYKCIHLVAFVYANLKIWIVSEKAGLAFRCNIWGVTSYWFSLVY